MGNPKLLIWLATVLVALFCIHADARQIESWSFQRLKDTADVIVVGSMASTKQWPERVQGELFGKHLEGQLTTFDVETVFKGKEIGKQIQVVHYRVKEGVLLQDGPILASFRKEGLRLTIESVNGVQHKAQIMEGAPRYLLFLKKRSDGKYEPVSGQIDSGLSLRKLAVSELDTFLDPHGG